MRDLVLYTNPQSRGRIAHWMLEEVGEDYDIQWIGYGAAMKSASYLKVNPMGKVPAISHKGAVVTECAAICAYLAAVFPDKGMVPDSQAGLAAYYRWLFFAAGPLEAAVTVRAMKWELTEEQHRSVGFGSYEDCIDTAELALAQGPFLCGEQFTAADVYFGSHINWGILFGTIEARPTFTAYTERLNARPALQRCNQINEDYLASLESA